MKRMLLIAAVFASSSLVGLASAEAQASPLSLSNQDLQTITSALAFPTSSERFFTEGRERFEREIQAFQQGSAAQTAELLTVDPTLLDQSQDLEQHFFDGLPQSDGDSSSSGPIR
ncbi:MAG: hypothetical protein ACFB4J_05135 [Elainellaceae cyanobacterium]